MPPDFSLRARWVVPVGSPPIDGGWVGIARGRVTAIGRGDPGGLGGRCIDLGDAVILPGLVNAHTHLEFSLLAEPLRPAAGHDGLPGWIRSVVASRRGSVRESLDASIRGGLVESAAEGVTAIGEIATRVAEPHLDPTGPRMRVFREGLGLAPERRDATVRGVARDLDRLGRAGVPAGVSPHAPYSVASDLGRRLIGIATERRLPVAMHLAESPDEDEFARMGEGRWRDLLVDLGAWSADAPLLRPAADWIGSLARAPRGLVVHATFLDDAALTRLARHADRLAVAVCPRTTRMLSGCLPPVARLASAGVRIAIGTDSRGSTPDLSVRRECAELVGAGLVSAETAMRMATVDAAWAIGLERIAGRLAPGRPADLAIIACPATARCPFDAAIDPGNRVLATLRGGRPIHRADDAVPIPLTEADERCHSRC